jgi:lipoyl(octanoyl) transferase
MVRQAPAQQSRAPERGEPIAAWWLGRVPYREAWDLQHRVVAARAAGLIGDQLIVLEHDPVLTLGRHSDSAYVRATPGELAARGVDLIRTERGGQVTYHGPGQLTAYPIVRLAGRGLAVGSFVHTLEGALARTCADLGVEAGPRDGYPGCWTVEGSRKIGAVGVRIERGVSYHGIALNVTVALSDFELIDACGLPGVESTSIARELGRPSVPTTASVAAAAAAFARALAGLLGAPLEGTLPPAADPARDHVRLEAMLTAAAGATAADGAAPTSAAPVVGAR